jgi:thioredoxin reductase
MKLPDWLTTLLSKKQPDPSYPDLPLVRENGESTVAGLYLSGDVGGTPLIKLGLNEGVDVVNRLHAELGAPAQTDPELLDVIIVGAGASGLAAAMRAHELGMRYQVLESERIATSVIDMYKGKVLFAEPEGLPNRSSMWFEECTREELLERWRAQVREAGLAVNEHEKVVDVTKSRGYFVVKTDRAGYRARRVIIALGKSGNPRKAGVPGEQEHPDKLHHSLSDPTAYRGKHVFVYGGGDVAAEAALALCANNDVTMVTIDDQLTFPRKRNVDALLAARAAGRLDLHLSSKLVGFDDRSVTFKNDDGVAQTVSNDVVFEMIGSDLPVPFFRRVGVRLQGDWHPKRWAALVGMFVFAYTLYALKKFPETPYAWPFTGFWSQESFAGAVGAVFRVAFSPFMWMFADEARQDILGTLWFQQGYLYSLLYTVVFVGFGYQAFIRWTGIARDPRYQRWRYVSLTSFQVGFFLLANVVGVHALSVENSWRVWGLSQPWPLFISWYNWWGDWIPRQTVLHVDLRVRRVGRDVG